MELNVERAVIALRAPFRIAGGTYTHANALLFHLRHDAIAGVGETALSSALAETPDTIVAALARHDFSTRRPYDFDGVLERLPPTVRCGVDTALHDWLGRDLGHPLYEIFGLDPGRTPCTSVSVGIGEIAETLESVRALADQPILKFKVGRGGEVELFGAVRGLYDGVIRIDANEGWSLDEAVRVLRELERYDIEFCEQPIPAGSPDALRYIRERTSIPIVADEDVRNLDDLVALSGCVDGIALTLAKVGGIRSAIPFVHAARALHLRTMIGSRVESALLNTAAAHISPLFDWADLDAPFQNADDPFRGLTYEHGKIVLPDGPGLGVTRV